MKATHLTIKTARLPQHLMFWDEAASLFYGRLVFGCEEKLLRMFWLNQRRAVRVNGNAVVTILLLKTYHVYHLPCSLKIINAFAFL